MAPRMSCCCLAVAVSLAADARGDETLPARLTDGFLTDSLKRYTTRGDVTWGKGSISLAPGAVLGRAVALGETAEMRATVQLPGGKGDAELGFRFRGKGVSAEAALRAAGGRLTLVNRERPAEAVPLAGEGREWVVRCRVRFGVLRARAWPSGRPEPSGWQTVRYSGWTVADLDGIEVRAGAGVGGTLLRLGVSGTRPDPPLPQESARKADRARAFYAEARRLHRLGRRAEATARMKEALRLCEEVYGRDHAWTAQLLVQLAEFLADAGDYPAARPVAERAVSLARERFGPEHPGTANALNVLGMLDYYTGRFDAAKDNWERALAARRRVLGPKNEATATTLDNLGSLFSSRGKYAAARKCHEEALAVYREALGSRHLDTLACMHHLAITLDHLGERPAARKLCRETLSFAEKDLPAAHPLTLTVRNTLGVLHQEEGDLAGARALLEPTFGLARKTLGPLHPITLQVRNNLGAVLAGLRDYASARPCLEETLAVQRRVLPAGHPAVGISAFNLAQLLTRLGHHERARPLYAEALAIHRKIKGPDDPDTRRLARALADCLNRLGDWPAARRMYEELLPGTRKDPRPLEAAELHAALGTLLLRQGEEPAAGRRHFERARAAYEKALGPGDPLTLLCLINQGTALLELHDAESARKVLDEAVALSVKHTGREARATAVALLNRGSARLQGDDVRGARADFDEALAVFRRLRDRGGAPPVEEDIATTLNSRGQLYLSQRDFAAALQDMKEALALTEKIYGPDSSEVALRQENLAVCLLFLGEAAAAREKAARAVAVYEKVLGPDHPRLATARENLAMALTEAGEHEAAWGQLTQSSVLLARHVRRTATALSRREQAPLIQYGFHSVYALLTAAGRRPPKVGQREQLLAHVLDWKDVRGSLALDRQEVLAVGGDRQALALLGRLRQTRQMLADVLIQGPGPMPPGRHHALLSALRRTENDLERALAEAAEGYVRQRQARLATPADLAARLAPGQALVELVRYTPVPRPEEFARAVAVKGPVLRREAVTELFHERYVALVLSRGPRVRVVQLGKAKPINEAVAAWRRAVQKGAADGPAERALRRCVWEPLAAALPEKTDQLFVAPDGELCLVPFEAIRLADGAYLVERYAVSYLSTGRDLMPRPRPAGRPGPALVVADPDYNALPGRAAPGAPAVGQLRGDDPALRKLGFVRLPGFAREAESAAKLLASAGTGWEVRTLFGGKASEEELGRVARPRLLYLVTHGFFLPDRPAPAPPLLRGLSLVPTGKPDEGLPAIDDPRLRSGLALSGANRWKERSARGLSDGLLTALEAEGLDLWGTELVVLSACETGLGEVRAGEGVLGLRRAFQLAGARTVVASLWKVPDRETERLMARFLAGWLAGRPKARALRDAQLQLIAQLRKSGDARHRGAPPLFWAAFVCHGLPD